MLMSGNAKLEHPGLDIHASLAECGRKRVDKPKVVPQGNYIADRRVSLSEEALHRTSTDTQGSDQAVVHSGTELVTEPMIERTKIEGLLGNTPTQGEPSSVVCDHQARTMEVQRVLVSCSTVTAWLTTCMAVLVGMVLLLSCCQVMWTSSVMRASTSIHVRTNHDFWEINT